MPLKAASCELEEETPAGISRGAVGRKPAEIAMILAAIHRASAADTAGKAISNIDP